MGEVGNTGSVKRTEATSGRWLGTAEIGLDSENGDLVENALRLALIVLVLIGTVQLIGAEIRGVYGDLLAALPR